MKKSQLRKIIKEEIKKLVEAGKIDRAYVKKSIAAFNRTSDPSNSDWKTLVVSIIKDLGAKPTKNMIEDLGQHLIIIYSENNDKFPRNFGDANDFKEMYELIYR